MAESTYILGISAFYHDSAAALVRDGVIVAAAQEERFTRIKHDQAFPRNAIDYCLAEAGIAIEDLSMVVFYEKPILKFERLLETYLRFSPIGLKSFLMAMPQWLGTKLHLRREIDRGLDDRYEGPIHFTTHHESHAASAFYPSPFERAAIITFDGVGEWTTTSIGHGEGNLLHLQSEIRFPHSLGLLYSAFTYYTGFKVNSGEYKVMGLAPYGEPRYAKAIREHLIDIRDDGSFRLNQQYFNYCAGLTMTNRRFDKLFGGPPRPAESRLTQREMDLAASIQVVVEEVMLKVARHSHKTTGLTDLCLAGGVALNCVGNGRILREGPFKRIWIQPASGDAGGALGAALYGWYRILNQPRTPELPDSQQGSYLGPDFKPDEVKQALAPFAANYTEYTAEGELHEAVADLLAAGKIVGHFAGRAEFGPRALGHRSILGDPRSPEMQAKMNVKIKFRESFRPFAPSCLEESCSDYFELEHPSPYMLLVAPVRSERRLEMSDQQKQLFGLDLLNQQRSDLPAITHVDYSARVQTVTAERSPRFHGIISAFAAKTGCSVLVNTSFNIRGEPIVGSPADAYRCFMYTDMDALVVGNCLCLKEDQPPMPGAEDYKRQFKLD